MSKLVSSHPPRNHQALERLGTMRSNNTKPMASNQISSSSTSPMAMIRPTVDHGQTDIPVREVAIYKYMKASSIALRILAASASLGATIVMGKNQQTLTIIEGSTMKARATYSPSFTYLVVANAFACLYSVSTILASVFLWRKKGQSLGSSYILFCFDLVMAALMTSAASSGAAISHIGRRGHPHLGWLPICNEFHRFCEHVAGSLIASYLVLLSFLLLSFCSVFVFFKHSSN